MKAVLIDFGGTIDTDGIHWSVQFLEAFQKVSITPSPDAWRSAFVEAERAVAREILPTDSFLRTLEKQVAGQLDMLKQAGIARRAGLDTILHVARLCCASALITLGTQRPILESLHGTRKLGLVSNFYGNLEAVCRELGIRDYFDIVVDSAVTGMRKPDPAIFRHALERLGMNAADTTVVGDSYENDIVPGKSVGCRTIWLRRATWDMTVPSEKADRIITSLKELERSEILSLQER